MIKNLSIATATLAAAVAATIALSGCGTARVTTGPPATTITVPAFGYGAQVPGQPAGVTFPKTVLLPESSYSISPTDPADGVWQQTITTK